MISRIKKFRNSFRTKNFIHHYEFINSCISTMTLNLYIRWASVFFPSLFMYIVMFYPSYVITSSKHTTKRQYSSLNRNDVGTGKLVICLITKTWKQKLLRIFFHLFYVSLFILLAFEISGLKFNWISMNKKFHSEEIRLFTSFNT